MELAPTSSRVLRGRALEERGLKKVRLRKTWRYKKDLLVVFCYYSESSLLSKRYLLGGRGSALTLNTLRILRPWQIRDGKTYLSYLLQQNQYGYAELDDIVVLVMSGYVMELMTVRRLVVILCSFVQCDRLRMP